LRVNDLLAKYYPGYKNTTEGIKGGSTMKDRCLYEVIVVEPDSGKVLYDEKVVGESKEDVMIECAVGIKEAIKNLKRKNVDIIYHELGGVRAATTEKEVKLIASADGYRLVKEK